jgi:hypothetical protein
MVTQLWPAVAGAFGVCLIQAPAGVLTRAGGVLAHAGGHTSRQNIAETLFLIGGMGLGWAAFRLRDVRLSGRPVASWAVGLLAVAALELSFVVPSRLGVRPAAVRPSTNATIAILVPEPGQVLRGNPAIVRVRLQVTGARIVTQTSTRLSPDKGHIHLYLDGDIATMAYATSTTLYGTPGGHQLMAELVATDHGPFNPPVTASVQFRVVP